MSYKTTTNINSLVGCFFHSLSKDTGKVERQGQVIGTPEPGWYLVQNFEWLMGEPSVCRLVKFEDMESWLFYQDNEALKHSYEHGIARAGGSYRDRD